MFGGTGNALSNISDYATVSTSGGRRRRSHSKKHRTTKRRKGSRKHRTRRRR
jgi:hypothetical protein